MDDKKGFIKLYRSLQKHWLWQEKPFSKGQAWVDILMECNHSDRKVLIGNNLILCKRGESLNSLDTWARSWGWNKSSVRRFINCLEKDEMVVIKKTPQTTHLIIINYNSYQEKRIKHETPFQRFDTKTDTDIDTETKREPTHLSTINNNTYKDKRNADETQMKRKRNADETRLTPNNELIKNVKNIKNSRPTSAKEVSEYAKSINFNLDGQKFMDHYESVGWVYGKSRHPIKDWRAAVRIWKNREVKKEPLRIQGTDRQPAWMALGYKSEEEYLLVTERNKKVLSGSIDEIIKKSLGEANVK